MMTLRFWLVRFQHHPQQIIEDIVINPVRGTEIELHRYPSSRCFVWILFLDGLSRH